MAQIEPFKALRYDPAKVGDLGKVVAPPYDVLSPAQQKAYHKLHSRNIVHLDFRMQRPGDAPAEKYRRAAEDFKRWRADGTLKADPQAALYVATQTYVGPDGRSRTFAGVYGLLKLEAYRRGGVRPHERTLSKPKADRLELTRATRANFSPIFMLFEDTRAAAARWMSAQMRRSPAAEFESGPGERHRLWVVDRPADTGAFTALLADRPVYIADGHHRYETMLAYSKEAPAALRAAAARTLVCLTPFQQPGLLILPTHRLLHSLKGFDPAAAPERLSRSFDLKKMAGLSALKAGLARAAAAGAKSKAPHAFGLVLPGALYLMSLKPTVDPLKAVPGRRSAAYKGLDVSLLQALVFEKWLGLTPESIAAQENIAFEKDAAEAARAVEAGRAQAAILVNATRMDQLKAVSDAKDVMPQKSTYFQPKLITGAVVRAMD